MTDGSGQAWPPARLTMEGSEAEELVDKVLLACAVHKHK